MTFGTKFTRLKIGRVKFPSVNPVEGGKHNEEHTSPVMQKEVSLARLLAGEKCEDTVRPSARGGRRFLSSSYYLRGSRFKVETSGL